MKLGFSHNLLRQGIAASKSGNRKEAERLLRQVLELDPNNETAWLWLSGAVDAASDKRHCLEQVLQLNPDHPHARAGLALLRKQSGGPAEVAARRVTAPSPAENPAAAGRLSPQVKGPGANCPFCAETVSAQATVCPHCHRELVVTCPRCEELSNVEDPTCGSCGYGLGDYRQGAPYYVALARAFQNNGKADFALAAWQQAAAIDAAHADALLNVGHLQVSAGDWERAQASFERAIQHDIAPARAYLALGQMYERQHRWEEAQKTYESALATDDSFAEAHFMLGRLFADGKALQAAFEHIRRATELDSQHAGAWYMLGRLYEVAQERRKAIKAYEQATTAGHARAPQHVSAVTQAAERLEALRPSLPPSVALNWPETVRRTAGVALIPVVAALVNGGLLPWAMHPVDFVGMLLAALGAYFWISASGLPQNPGMRAMLGKEGLSEQSLRMIVGALGVCFWVVGLLYILLAPGRVRVW
jgi:tetratricopeptide (TPR) repeat protein